MPRLGALLALLAVAVAAPARAQPQALAPVGLDLIATLPGGTVGLAYEPVEDRLYVLTGGGDLYRLRPAIGAEVEAVATGADYGAPARAFGIASDAEGTLFVVGSRPEGTENVGLVRRGRMEVGVRVWTTVAQTEPYPLGRTAYDHSLSAIAVSPDGIWLALNSGSRTDHGETQDSQGVFPGTREVPLTSAILRVPADATDLVIPADSAALVDGGFLFADGTRNSFGLAFSPDGELFGAENAGDRDDGDELNWLRPGRHYGFPWRIGTNDTPQRFPGYDPDADPLVDPASTAYQNGDFYDDPTYPPPPPGVTFTDPIPNRGPDADRFRQPDGSIVDASDTGRLATTFTPHRSPLGLVWSPPIAVAGGGIGCHAFVLSWTDGESPLLVPFDDPGEDLLCLVFEADYAALSATRLVAGFRNPIATATDRSGRLFVAEFSDPYGLWAVGIEAIATAPPPPDGVALAVAPNPSRGSSTLALTLAAAGPARVRILDALGRTVATVHDGPLAAGTTRVAVPSLSAGVYLAVIEAGGGRIVRPLTVVR